MGPVGIGTKNGCAVEDQQNLIGLDCQHQCLPEHWYTNIPRGKFSKGEVVCYTQNSNNRTGSLIHPEPEMDQCDVKWPNDVLRLYYFEL
jgi:hypothetical protein